MKRFYVDDVKIAMSEGELTGEGFVSAEMHVKTEAGEDFYINGGSACGSCSINKTDVSLFDRMVAGIEDKELYAIIENSYLGGTEDPGYPEMEDHELWPIIKYFTYLSYADEEDWPEVVQMAKGKWTDEFETPEMNFDEI